MSRAASIYKFTCGPLGADVLLVGGGFYKLLSASGEIKVSREGGSAIGPLLPGQGERENFTRLTIQDMSGAANSGYILIADNSFEDTRIYGSVEVIDGGFARTMALDSFCGGAVMGPVVGQYSHVQLWNPLTNPASLAVSQVVMSSPSATPLFHLRWGTTALANVWAFNPTKKIGAGFSLSDTRFESNAAAMGTGSVQMKAYGSAYVPFVVRLNEPLILAPGYGLIALVEAVNTTISASFDYFEFTP